jgi:Tfp pilus assembly protein PilO
MNNSSTKKYLPLILASAALLILIFVIIFPTIKKIKKLNDEISNERQKLEEYYAKGQSLKNSKVKYAEIKNNMTELDKIFIVEGKELDLITRLEIIADQTGVSQNINLLPEKIETRGQLKKMPVSLQAAGSYPRLINYLRAVENADFYFNVESLAFSQGGQLKNHQITTPEELAALKSNPNISLDLKGFVYYYSDNKK